MADKTTHNQVHMPSTHDLGKTSEPDFGFFTAHDKAAEAAGNIIRIVFASIVVTGLWVIGTVASLYFALTTPSESWVQSAASESLVTFLLFLLSPILFFVWKSRSKVRIALSTLVAVGLVALSSYQHGLSQQLLIGIGCGVVLLQFLDFLIKGAWQAQIARMEARAKEMSGESTVVLGH